MFCRIAQSGQGKYSQESLSQSLSRLTLPMERQHKAGVPYLGTANLKNIVDFGDNALLVHEP
jgi:hypothetical protein